VCMDPEERLQEAFGIITEKGGSVTFGDNRIRVSSHDGDAEVDFVSVRENPEVNVGPDGTGHATVSSIIVRIGDEEHEMPVDGTTDIELGGFGPLLEAHNADR